MAPSAVDCASARGSATKITNSTAKNPTTENPIALLLIESLPKNIGHNAPSSAQCYCNIERDTKRTATTTHRLPTRAPESEWGMLLPHEQSKSNRENVEILGYRRICVSDLRHPNNRVTLLSCNSG